jgi:hypothetical protein
VAAGRQADAAAELALGEEARVGLLAEDVLDIALRAARVGLVGAGAVGLHPLAAVALRVAVAREGAALAVAAEDLAKVAAAEAGARVLGGLDLARAHAAERGVLGAAVPAALRLARRATEALAAAARAADQLSEALERLQLRDLNETRQLLALLGHRSLDGGDLGLVEDGGDSHGWCGASVTCGHTEGKWCTQGRLWAWLINAKVQAGPTAKPIRSHFTVLMGKPLFPLFSQAQRVNGCELGPLVRMH